jgi:apolipoprotein N-acyltransferase
MVHHKQVGMARASVRPGEVDLVVFPENSVIRLIEGTPYLQQFRDLSAELRTPLLAGVNTRTDEGLVRWQRGLPEEVIHVGRHAYGFGHNSAAVITPQGIVAKYRKMHLLPFSERVPGEDLFAALGMLHGYRAFIVSVLGYMGTGIPGEKLDLLSIPGTRYPPFWTPICFEQADARLARQAARRGARYFINITSEGDLGPQIYWNTAAVAVIRAAELKVGIARCGNFGISGIIDPWGRQTHVLRGKSGALWGEAGVLKARVPLGPGVPTLYARLGDWPAPLAALVLLAALLRPGPAAHRITSRS